MNGNRLFPRALCEEAARKTSSGFRFFVLRFEAIWKKKDKDMQIMKRVTFPAAV